MQDTMDTTPEIPANPWLRGFKRATPIVLGYLPVAVAFGVLAQKNGISGTNAVLMSLIVFAGASQFIAVGLIASGAGPLAVIATTFMVNLRHLLMSAALTPHLKGWSKPLLSLFGFGITDESFALHTLAFTTREPDARESLAVNFTAYCSWVVGTWTGIAASGLIGDVRPMGLDYALPAMFIALLTAQLKDRVHVLTALAAGAFSVILLAAGLSQANVILATVVAASLGTGIVLWNSKRSS
ncbi:MAG: branched-chain amino acid ABC transporter permease [Desulfovibrio sp.]|nr:MAG: branched-chain amino acid ABC transporter permease [Desulfovibrio sp.]